MAQASFTMAASIEQCSQETPLGKSTARKHDLEKTSYALLKIAIEAVATDCICCVKAVCVKATLGYKKTM